MTDATRLLCAFREWRCICAAWNPMEDGSCACGLPWHRSAFGGRLVVR